MHASSKSSRCCFFRSLPPLLRRLFLLRLLLLLLLPPLRWFLLLDPRQSGGLLAYYCPLQDKFVTTSHFISSHAAANHAGAVSLLLMMVAGCHNGNVFSYICVHFLYYQEGHGWPAQLLCYVFQFYSQLPGPTIYIMVEWSVSSLTSHDSCKMHLTGQNCEAPLNFTHYCSPNLPRGVILQFPWAAQGLGRFYKHHNRASMCWTAAWLISLAHTLQLSHW